MFDNGKNIVFIIILAALFNACKEKNEVKEYSARVEKDYLYNRAIDSALITEKYKNFYKDEFVNQWVRDQLLYNEAVKEGITEDQEYKRLIENIKKEAVIAVYLNKLSEDFDLSYTEDDLKKFYKENIEEFRCGDDAYVINEIDFVSQDKALQFRNTLFESGWDNTLKVFKGDPTIRRNNNRKFLFANEIQPFAIYRVVANMQNNDVSILIESEPGVFTIVQLVKSFLKDTVPDFEYVSDLVKGRYLIKKRKALTDQIIQKLYSKYDIEIKKDK